MNNIPKRGRGRPRKPTNEVLCCQVRIFLKQADRIALQALADRDGVSLSKWLRRLAMEKIERELQ